MTTTHPRPTPASPKTPLELPDEPLDERSRRARTEPMSVIALGDGYYEVDAASGNTYLVDIETPRCTCPDHAFRDVRCKHIRRVAIEITDGRTPPPGKLAVTCVDCGERLFVDETATGPFYCDRHSLFPGATVIDRETGDRLVVVSLSDLRADAVQIPDADCTVAEYATNDAYRPDEPVVGAIYPHATIATNGVIPERIKVYVYPRTRLQKQ